MSLTRQPSTFLCGEKRQAFLQVERGGYVLQRQAELHHREGDVGLNPDDQRLRGAQTLIVGIQPDVAFAMVQLGLTLEDIPTALDLEEGLSFFAAKKR